MPHLSPASPCRSQLWRIAETLSLGKNARPRWLAGVVSVSGRLVSREPEGCPYLAGSGCGLRGCSGVLLGMLLELVLALLGAEAVLLSFVL